MKVSPILTMLLLCLLATSFGYSQNPCNNLLSNPDFESGLDNWTSNGAATASSDAYSGSQSGAICDGSGSISKAIACTPGQEYSASVWAKRSANSSSYSNIQLRFLTSSYSPISGNTDGADILNNTYTKIELSATAPANAAYVHLYTYRAPGDGCIFLDEASVCEAEETNDCIISASVSNLQCYDNGTPNDPFDDLFSIDILVTNSGGGTGFIPNTPTGGLISSGDYGVTYTYGPALISAANFNPNTAFIRDIDNPDCATTYAIGAPEPCSVPTSNCNGNNSLTNGGFENGLSDWTTNGSATLSSSSSAFSGSAAGQICGGSGSISKAIPTTPGTIHYASLWAGAANGTTTSGLTYANAELRFLTSSYSPIPGATDSQNIGISGYTKLDFSGIAPADAAFVHLYIYKANGGCLYIDEAEMCEGNNTGTADLVILDASCPDQYPDFGATQTYEILVQNNGTAPSSETTISLFQDYYSSTPNDNDPQYAQISVPVLQAGDFITLTMNLDIPDNPGNNIFPVPYIFGNANAFYRDFYLSLGTTPLNQNDYSLDFYCKKYNTNLAIDYTTGSITYENDGQISYTVNVTNTGSENAYNVMATVMTNSFVNGFQGTVSNPPVGRLLDYGPNSSPKYIVWHIPFLSAGSTTSVFVQNVAYNPDLTTEPGDSFSPSVEIASGHNANPNPGNDSYSMTFLKNTSGGNIDLELSMTQGVSDPQIYSSYPVNLTISNTGTEKATDIQVDFRRPSGVVYNGSNPYTATEGVFYEAGTQWWVIDELAAGASETLTINYFLLQDEAPVAYAQVRSVNESDADSTPNNGLPPTPIEDDEASTADTVTPPNNTESGCYFEQTYPQINQLSAGRTYAATENQDGSITIDMSEIFDFGFKTERQIEISETGVFESINAGLTGGRPNEFEEDGELLFLNNGVLGTNGNYGNIITLSKYTYNDNSNSNTATLIWESTFVVPAADSVRTRKVAKLSDGGYLLYGSYLKSTTDPDYYPYYIKTDENRNVLWMNTDGASLPNPSFIPSLTFVKESKDGGYFFKTFNQSPTKVTSLLKVDDTGDLSWSKNYDSNQDVTLSSLEEGGLDNAVYIGTTQRDLTTLDFFASIQKTNSSGSTLWTKSFPVVDGYTYDPALLTIGEDVVFGYSYRSNDFQDFLYKYAKLNSSGTLIWEKEYDNDFVRIYNIIQLMDGGLLFTGFKDNSASVGPLDTYVLKTTSKGNLIPVCEDTTNPNPSMDLPCDVSYTFTVGNLTISGLSADHIIVKLFGPNWETLYTCLDNCNNPLTLDNLPEGTYRLSVDKYNSSWQQECNFLEDIVINNSMNLQGQDSEDFSIEQALEEITLFPNPVANNLQLSLASLIGEEVQISIYNQLGQPLQQLKIEEVDSTPISFDVSAWNAGLYFINITTKNHKARTLRFVKARL